VAVGLLALVLSLGLAMFALDELAVVELRFSPAFSS
jgi:hypothetical protein